MKYNPIEFYVKDGWRNPSGADLFGPRIHPITGGKDYHHGIDFGGKPRGADIKTPYGGKVVGVGSYPGRGRTVTIRIAEGILQNTQHHDKMLVKVGDIVRARDVIATNGTTGDVTGPHIHYELRKDVPALSGRPIGRYVWGDPAEYFAVGDEGASRRYHIVKSGETLYIISRNFEVTVEQLRAWNDRTPAQDRSLSIGTKLWIEPHLEDEPCGYRAEIDELKKELLAKQGELSAAMTQINNMQKDFSTMVKIGKKNL